MKEIKITPEEKEKFIQLEENQKEVNIKVSEVKLKAGAFWLEIQKKYGMSHYSWDPEKHKLFKGSKEKIEEMKKL